VGEGEPDFKVPLPNVGEGFRVRAGTFARGLLFYVLENAVNFNVPNLCFRLVSKVSASIVKVDFTSPKVV
jgi:hypothetical protein